MADTQLWAMNMRHVHLSASLEPASFCDFNLFQLPGGRGGMGWGVTKMKTRSNFHKGTNFDPLEQPKLKT